jgi:hypothetical protein
MRWLRAAIAGFFDALFNWGQGQREKPGTATDANTPKPVADELARARDDWMRDKDRNSH